MAPAYASPRGNMNDLYKRLDLVADNDIRLITVLPSNGIGPIACEMEVAHLSNNRRYIALSYTWGPAIREIDPELEDDLSKPTHPILCKAKSASGTRDQEFWHEYLVTSNLHDFLVQVQSNEALSHDSYWIDAICINQNDPEERTRQVGIMAAIYQSASIVYAWLGKEDKDTHKTFELIRALSGRCYGNERHSRIKGLIGITPAALSSEDLTANLGVCADADTWKALAIFFDRRYFTRVWTIQEITLAKKLVAYCGSNYVDWEDIVKVSEFLTVTPWTKWIADITGSRAHYHSVPNIVDANKSSRNMLYSLIRFRRFSSIDPRDKVYALLSLAEDSLRRKRRFSPIYGRRSVAETYTMAATQILEDSDDLLLLACAEGDRFRTIPLLPSWVPDWSCAHALGLGVTGYRRFSAAANIPRTLEINEWERSLAVKGFRLDDIVYAGESKQDVVDGKPFPNWLTIINSMAPIYHTGQPRSEVFWRTLISDTAGTPPSFPASRSYRSSYHTWITSRLHLCIGEHGNEYPYSSSQAFEVLSASELSPTESLSRAHCTAGAENTEDDAESNDYETTFSYSRHLRPFLTSRRYLGVGSESLGENDSVWIVAGSRVPLILRQVNSGTFKVVGGAYVHGFMRGEALAWDPVFSTISLV